MLVNSQLVACRICLNVPFFDAARNDLCFLFSNCLISLACTLINLSTSHFWTLLWFNMFWNYHGIYFTVVNSILKYPSCQHTLLKIHTFLCLFKASTPVRTPGGMGSHSPLTMLVTRNTEAIITERSFWD